MKINFKLSDYGIWLGPLSPMKIQYVGTDSTYIKYEAEFLQSGAEENIFHIGFQKKGSAELKVARVISVVRDDGSIDHIVREFDPNSSSLSNPQTCTTITPNECVFKLFNNQVEFLFIMT